MKREILALKPYLEKIEQLCAPLDRGALTGLILAMARQVEPEERRFFLGTVLSQLHGEDEPLAIGLAAENMLVDEIAELRQEILARISSIEDGSYWDEPEEEWEDSYYDDEAPDLLNNDQKAELADFFNEAGRLFMAGEKNAAREVYGALLSLVNEAESYGFLPDFQVDLREARARHARCVFETAAAGERVQDMLAAMDSDLAANDMGGLVTAEYPLLQDVIDADTGAMDGFDQFLASWQDALQRQDFQQDRVADLRLEAAFLQGGVPAVEELARDWQAQQQRGYLYWLQKLENGEEWASLQDACREAFSVLPYGSERREVAACQIRAGKKLQQADVVLEGYRERFKSQPSEGSLLDLVAEADRQQVRERELAEIRSFLAGCQDGGSESVLLVKTLLMAGKVDEAFAMCEGNKPVGWSVGSATGLMFATVLHLSCGGHADCGLIPDLLRDYADRDSFYIDSFDDSESKADRSGFQEITRGLGLVDPATVDLSRFRQWARNIGEKRVNHIVSGKQRTAYARASKVLAALAESLAVIGRKGEAQALLQDYCKVRYNRHVAFRKEVKRAVGQSAILRGMAAGL